MAAMASSTFRSGVDAVLLAVCLLSLSFAFATSLPIDATRRLLIPLGDGSFGSIENTFSAVSVLSVTNDPTLDASKSCTWAAKQTPDTLSSASALLQLSALVCSSTHKGVAASEKLLLSSVPETTKDVYEAVAGLAAVKSKGWSSASDAEYKTFITSAITTLEGLKLPTGYWKASKDSPAPSALSAGYALKTVATVFSMGLITKDKAQSLAKDVRALFSTTVQGEAKALHFAGLPTEGGALPATSALVSGYLSLAAALDTNLEVSKEAVLGLGLFLSGAGAPLSLSEAFILFDAFAALNSNSFAVPVIAVLPGHFSISSSAAPSVSLQTVLGNGVSGASVSIVSAKLSLKGSSTKTVAQSKDLEGQGPEYPLPADVLSSTSALGSYSLKLEISGLRAPHIAPSSVIRTITATAKITTSPVTVSISDSDKGQAESQAIVDLQNTKPELKTLSGTHLQKLKVSVSLTGPSGQPFIPHQAFLSMKHSSGVDHHFLLKAASDNSGLLSLKIELLESLEKLFYLSGVYTLTITLGDSYMENSGSWALCAVDLDLPEAPEGAAKPPAVALSVVERFQPQSEISHIFRKPDRRPPTPVSLLFTALTLLPLGLLFVGLLALGVNMKLLPCSGLPFISAIAFHGGIAAILLLYVAFWVEVKLFTTLKVLIILGLLTAVPGHYILSFLSDSTAKVKTS